jgi:GT2 family glycosyltransferase
MVAEHYPWARWYEGPAKGPGPNRNVGVREARGEFVAFVDDDCIPSKEWLAGFAASLTPEVDIYEGKTVCGEGLRSPLEDAPVNEVGGMFWTCNLMVRRERFLELGGFDEHFRIQEDLDFRLRLKQQGCTHRFVPEALVDHPPRPIRWGKRNNNFNHDLVAVWYKSGRREPVRKRLLRFIFRERLARLRQYRFSPASLKALASVAEELWYARRHVHEWEQEFRQRYEGREPAYPFPYPHF